ncbi:hydrophobic surface binding protein A-domain-containing protein [Bisporella sp. PMI_857]|nr:hydrophobic surface binding protein A-domain-containing protein [Bisporella sp. PMI_857]
MRYSMLLLPLLPITFALPYVPRSAPQVLDTIDELSTAVTDLTTAVNNFDGSLLGLIPQSLAIVKASTTLDVTILKATFLTSQSANFTSEESTQIVLKLAGQIGPIQASLEALKAKQPLFKQALIAPVVLLNLKVLKAHTGDFITALTAKVTPQLAGLLGIGATILNQAFDAAITVFEG